MPFKVFGVVPCLVLEPCTRTSYNQEPFRKFKDRLVTHHVDAQMFFTYTSGEISSGSILVCLWYNLNAYIISSSIR